MAGGLAAAMRFAAFARNVALSSVLLVTVAAVLEIFMPSGIRPSDLYGGLYGAMMAAEYRAKTAAAAAYAYEQAEAQAAPTSRWQMEQVVSQTQQQAVASGMGAQAAASNIADMLCYTGKLLGPNSGLDPACDYGKQIRSGMAQELANTARSNGALVNR